MGYDPPPGDDSFNEPRVREAALSFARTALFALMGIGVLAMVGFTASELRRAAVLKAEAAPPEPFVELARSSSFYVSILQHRKSGACFLVTRTEWLQVDRAICDAETPTAERAK